MSYDIKELLKLPDEEKIAIADLLYNSVNDDDFDENEELKPWYEDEEFVKELDKEFQALKEGKAKGYTLNEVKSFMEDFKAKYKRERTKAQNHWQDENFIAELEKRSDDYKSGKVKGISWEESKAKILNSRKKK
jgi:hypothetical protein